MNINEQITRAKERPVLTGVATVIAVFSVGVGIAFATGMVSPAQTYANGQYGSHSTPTCSLSSSASSEEGGSTRLTWHVSGASYAEIDHGIGGVDADGSRNISSGESGEYTLTAHGSGDSKVRCSTMVEVYTPPASPTCTISTSASTIVAGSSATISWNATNAASASLSGYGPVALAGSVTVSPTQTTTYTLTLTDSRGRSVECCKTTIVVTRAPAAPTCTLSASPNSVVSGGTSKLTWTTSNASNVAINGTAVSPGANGSIDVTPANTATYTLVASGAGGSVNCVATVTVVPPSAPTCTLTASPSSITHGSATTLSWTTRNASQVSIESVGSVAANGTTTLTPGVTTTYVLTAVGTGGSVTCSATITVITPAAPTCTLTASPTTITSGGSSGLVWSSTNANSVTIDQGIGGVSTGGSRTVTPSGTTTYTMTASGTGGTVHCAATVTVNPPTPTPACTLTASPNSITSGGSTVLTWNTQNVTSFTIDQGVGSVAPVAGGSVTVTPGGNRTYTGTAVGPGGTVTCATTVSVNTVTPGPTCSMTMSPSTIYDGQDSELAWHSDNVRQVYISGGAGYTGQNGSRTISLGVGTYTYEGTFYGTNGQTISCSATLRVNPRTHSSGPRVSLDQLPPAGNQPLSYISLSDLPYTGLDLGPVGTAMYWLMLILWSLALAYLILFGALPYAYKRVVGIGHDGDSQVSAAAQATHEVQLPITHSTLAPETAESARMHSAYDGFKSFASDNGLSIEDIVKGLSRETVQEYAPVPVAPMMQEVRVEAPVLPVTVPVAPQAPTVSQAVDIHPHIPGFLANLLAGNKDEVFGTIRSINQSGGDSLAFLTHAVFALDDAYRAKIDGTPVHPEVARVCENCAPNFLERVVTSLATAVDASYSTGVTGVKLALTRALSVIDG